MLMVHNGNVLVEGKAIDCIAESAILLHEVYRLMKENLGEDEARKHMAAIGRLATMDGESEEDVVNALEGIL